MLSNAFTEEKVPDANGNLEERIVLRIPAPLAPIKAAILPLVRKDGLDEKARRIIDDIKFDFNCQYDEKDSIGRRYRRQDAIGTPFCITVDHQTMEDDTVTIRYRDSMKQDRVSTNSLREIIGKKAELKNQFCFFADYFS